MHDGTLITFGAGSAVNHFMGVSLTSANGIAVVAFSNQPPADRRFVLLSLAFAKGGTAFVIGTDTSAFVFDSISFFGPIVTFTRGVSVQPVGPWTFLRASTINVQMSPAALPVGGTLDIALYGKLVL